MDIDAVILAGGQGTRLRPFTVSIPKPLVPLGDEPIIEILLRQLAASGISRVHLALGHLAELMKAYFDQVHRRHDLELIYSIETEPLGTVGPIRRLDRLSDTFLLINGDILTTMRFEDMVAAHQRNGAIATVAVHRRSVPIDYGVIDVTPEGAIVGHTEKPRLDLTVGMGIYAFSRRVVDYIPAGGKFDIPDLLRRLIAEGERVAACHSDDYWMDIGRPEDYEIACRDYTESPERFVRRRATLQP